MNSYVGMTMVKKEQRQDDYFSQHYQQTLQCFYYLSTVLFNNG